MNLCPKAVKLRDEFDRNKEQSTGMHKDALSSRTWLAGDRAKLANAMQRHIDRCPECST